MSTRLTSAQQRILEHASRHMVGRVVGGDDRVRARLVGYGFIEPDGFLHGQPLFKITEAGRQAVEKHLVKTIEQSPLEKYRARREEDTRRAARKHTAPRLDAFRERLSDIPTSKLVEYVADYRGRMISDARLYDALLCGEVLVPYSDNSRGWTSHEEGRPPCESYPQDYDTLHAGYVAVCDEIDRRFLVPATKGVTP